MYYYMEYSESRGTWNVFSEDGEWIYEGSYDTCAQMVDRNNAACLEYGYCY